MKIKIKPESLKTILGIAASAISNKIILPIERYMYFSVKDGYIVVAAGSQRYQVRCRQKINSKMEFATCIPAQTFAKTIEGITVEEATIEYKIRENGSEFIQIKAGRSKYKIDCVQEKDFHHMILSKDYKEIKVTGESWVEHGVNAAMCAKEDEINTSLSGVNISFDTSSLKFCGANGFFTTMQNTEAVSEGFTDKMVPSSFFNFLSGIKFSGETIIRADDKKVSVRCGGVQVVCTVIDAEFPAVVDEVFKKPKELSVSIKTSDLIDALKRARLYVNNEDKVIAVDINGDTLTIIAENDAYNNEAEEVIDIKNNTIGSLTIGMTSSYLSQILGKINTDFIDIFMTTEKKPIFIYPSKDHINQRWLLMPCTLSDLKEKRLKRRREKEEKEKKKLAKKGTV